jgi:hypothetical protein
MAFTPEYLVRICASPFYAVNFDESLFGDHEAILTKEDWVLLIRKPSNKWVSRPGCGCCSRSLRTVVLRQKKWRVHQFLLIRSKLPS